MQNPFQKIHPIHELFLQEREAIQIAVTDCEKNTSGEVRIFIESKCAMVDTLDRAEQIFRQLKMHATANRNGVLIYVAYQHKEFALYGDAGAIQKFEKRFWQHQANLLSYAFTQRQFLSGMQRCLANLKLEFDTHFPHKGEKKNELPDEIMFGK
jgi:uncharacterized membrane protein